MNVDLLVERRWLVPAALAILLVAGPVAGGFLAARPRLAWWLTGTASTLVIAITLLPDDRRLDARCVIQWSPPWPGRVEPFANVVLFVAPVLLGAVAARRPSLAFVAGSAGSAVIEAVQATLRFGRSCDTNDWMSNTIGAAAGASLGWVALRLSCRHLRARSSSGPTSTPNSPVPPGSGSRACAAGWRRGT